MKKLPLAIVTASLLMMSTGFSEQYSKYFEVSLDIPSSISVEAFQRASVNLTEENLKDALGSEGTLIGSMKINTTAKSCTANITTTHDFKLVGTSEKIPYTLEYISTNLTGNSVSRQFTSNYSTTVYNVGKNTGCNGGDLKMRLSRSDVDSKHGMYSDVIRVEIQTES